MSLAVTGVCANGVPGQIFGRGVFGCPGSVTWAQRATLCPSGAHPANANEWLAAREGYVPAHDYWTNDDLRYVGTKSGSCSANLYAGAECANQMPMRVCTLSGTDPEGNHCNWTGCGFGSLTNAYFGGCSGNATAGTLCVPDGGCADGVVDQALSDEMSGCAGAVAYRSRQSLCAAGYRVASAEEWAHRRAGTAAPTHDYWTNDPLLWSGTASSSCSVGFTGNACANGAMHVCTAAGNDPEGNTCNWRHCGLGASSPDDFFGGCSATGTAGALCVPAVDTGTTCREIAVPSQIKDEWDDFTMIHLGWVVPRSQPGCPDVPTPQGSYVGASGAAWLADRKSDYDELVSVSPSYVAALGVDSFESYVRRYLVPAITGGMLDGTETFCVYERPSNDVDGVVTAKADHFAAVSSSNTALSSCEMYAAGGVITRVRGCPKCLEKSLGSDGGSDADGDSPDDDASDP